MIKDTQTLIVQGNQEIISAIKRLNSDEAKRQAMRSITILEALVSKHVEYNIGFQDGGYDSVPCGPAMTDCNNAFLDLCKRLEDIFSTSFNEEPKGDKQRISEIADKLMLLLTNSYYSLTWLNSNYYKEKHPEDQIPYTDTAHI